MRLSFLLLVAALGGLAVAPFPKTPASASCTGPYFEVAEGLVLERGTTVTVEGRGFAEGCSDSMGCEVGPGCDDCEYDDPPERPMTEVALVLRQGNRTWELAVDDAGSAADDRLGWTSWTFEVPADVKPGRARLLASPAQPAPVTITIR